MQMLPPFPPPSTPPRGRFTPDIENRTTRGGVGSGSSGQRPPRALSGAPRRRPRAGQNSNFRLLSCTGAGRSGAAGGAASAYLDLAPMACKGGTEGIKTR
jgi:hypothetical protein